VYHQVKELQRVLVPHYNVRIMLSEYMFPHTDPADDDALYILMTPHLCVELPPHYIIWQTEQWGHSMLKEGNKRWANQRNARELQDFIEVFEVSTPHNCQCLPLPYPAGRIVRDYQNCLFRFFNCDREQWKFGITARNT
jgi:hypothetical protein